MNEQLKLAEIIINRANKVNLPDFLNKHGLLIRKMGKSYILNDCNSLNIKDNKNGEKGKWYNFATSEGGDNISFVRRYMTHDFTDAVLMLIDFEKNEI